jgi:large subunit ribosomal protein L25
MKVFELEGTVRPELGKKSASDLRKQDSVPCVLYGGKENVNFFVTNPAIRDLIYTPNVYIVNIKLGKATKQAVMREIQFHPVTDIVLHIDFYEITDDKEVAIELPIRIVGNSVGVRKGGKVKQTKRMLKIKALPKNLPDILEVDITDLDVEQTIKVEDIKYDNLVMLNGLREPVVSVVASRATAKAEAGK